MWFARVIGSNHHRSLRFDGALIAGVAMILGSACWGSAVAQLADRTPDLSGVWLAASARGSTGGARPAMTPRAQADADTFDPLEDPVIRCVPPGFPRTGAGVYPWEIVQTDEMILFLYEAFGMVRRIYMDGREPPAYFPPGLMGFSVGRWEGDEFVIRTTHYAPGLLTGSGIRQYGDMVVDERYQLVDDGHGLKGEIVITAPQTFKVPWRRDYSWERDPDGMIFEAICDPAESRF
jgi:hypothetical protein